MSQSNALIIGGSSQLSKEISKQLLQQDLQLVLLVQNAASLDDLPLNIKERINIFEMDIFDSEQVIGKINQIWQEFNGFDLVLINTGLNNYDPELSWSQEKITIAVNVQGFAAICNTVFKCFKTQGYGQLGVINSIAALRGGANIAYHASKAFAKNYLEGLSMHAQRLKLAITITELQLGFLDKAAQENNKLWQVPIAKVARQSIKALQKGKRKVYISKRWRIIAWISKLLPEYIYNTRRWKK